MKSNVLIVTVFREMRNRLAICKKSGKKLLAVCKSCREFYAKTQRRKDAKPE
jgi:hypothetical protein